MALSPELDTDLVPNLGSKVNHHFQYNNSAFGEYEHPRWGVIVGVGTTKPIKARSLLHYHEKKTNSSKCSLVHRNKLWRSVGLWVGGPAGQMGL